jgi:hypothetical protein
MKLKKLTTFFFVCMGIVGLVLLIFGSQFDGTLSQDILKAGMVGIGIFALWAVANLTEAYMKKRELENM